MEVFFRELEESLRGEVPESEIRDSLNYYRQYFAEQKAMGYSENEIIESLGSPRLIARSIIDAREAVSGQDAYGGGQADYYDGGAAGSYNSGQGGYYGSGQGGGTDPDGYYDAREGRYRSYEDDRTNIQIKKIGGLKLVFGIILVLIVLALLIRVLLPVVVVLIPVLLILRLIRDNR